MFELNHLKQENNEHLKVGGDVPNHVINSILPFIRLVFDSLLVHASDVELVPVCSESLFYLICSFPNHFEPVLNEKSQQCTQDQKDKINQSFMPVFQQKKEHFKNELFRSKSFEIILVLFVPKTKKSTKK